MAGRDTTHLSKLISLILRHRPGDFGIALDEHGWADVEELLDVLVEQGESVERTDLDAIVNDPANGRFMFSEDGIRIRARHGHSVQVVPVESSAVPPDALYHGTVERALERIRATGLLPQARRFVHLSETIERAGSIASRHGRPVILTVDAAGLHASGARLFRTASGVWLVGSVPVPFLRFPDQ